MWILPGLTPVRNKANFGNVSSLECLVGADPRVCPSGGRPRGAAPTNFTLESSNTAAGRACETNPISRRAGAEAPIDGGRVRVYDGLRMQMDGTRLMVGVLIASALSLLGCGGQNAVPPPTTQIVCEDGVTAAEAVQAAASVLTRMHFSLEKMDAEAGVVRTRPLRGAQFFEFWRSDNASVSDTEEASVQSIRRIVEVRVRTEDRGQRTEDGSAYSLQPTASGLCVSCAVAVQRLSIPESEVAGDSEAYRINVGRTPALQRLWLSPQQQQRMTWIDLGEDPDLAAKILARVEQELQRAK